MHVVIAGGSGFVGGYFAKMLIEQRHQVTVLTHSDIAVINARLEKHHGLSGKVNLISYDDYNGEGDVLFNFAGESFGAKAITTRRLNLLLSSRLDIINKFKTLITLPPIYVQASAVAIYDDKGNGEIDENSPTNGDNEIAELTRKLEAAAQELNERFNFKHFYIARFGIVLHRNGGFIKKSAFTPPFTILHAENKVPFIELHDTLNALMLMTEGTLPSGPVNLVSPQSATLKELLACCFKHSKLPPIPIMTGFLKLGDRRMILLKADQDVKPNVLLQHGFKFYTPDISKVD